MSLDDLLTSAPEHRREPEPGRFTVSGVVYLVVAAGLGGFAAYQVLRLVGYQVSYVLLASLLLAGLMARKLTSATHGVKLAGPTAGDPADDAELGEDPYRAARQWMSRLADAEQDKRAFARRVHPAITALVDERLRLRHGVHRERDPDRARQIMGEELWTFVTEPPRRQPARHRMDHLARQIEQLWMEER